MAQQGRFVRRLLMAVDIEGYSRRTAATHYDAQVRLLRIVQCACRYARIRQVEPQESGDGLMLVFPPGLDEARVVPALIRGFRHGLYENNRDPGEFGPIRARMAIVEGATARSPNGYAGPASILVNDLVGVPVLKRKLADARPDSDVAVIVPHPLYADLVSQNYPGLSREHFSRVELALRGEPVVAWICLPLAGPAPDPHGAEVRWDGVATVLTVSGLATVAAEFARRHRAAVVAAGRATSPGGRDTHHRDHDDPDRWEHHPPSHHDDVDEPRHDLHHHDDDLHHHDDLHHDDDQSHP
ncbi:hypothetical protein ACIBO1_16720 [Micromonospora sp. NPDC049903]|uniref:hypothetical protein n=1 Tax=Micromonospora sp. NPDC049903 TaxID=3364276 RepID=UPI0037A686DE